MADRVPADTPVPDRAMPNDGLGALLVIETLPVTPPTEVGANFTLNEVLCPAPSVIGSVSPLMLKPVPLAELCERVTEDPPVLVRVTVWD